MYLGRAYDLKAKKATDTPVHYDPDDLTTHGVIVGMTGSGKTGLGIDLLEEAALAGIPALLIDPKGDLANLLLHFPGLAASDFEPWIAKDEARRAGSSVPDLAGEMAERWRTGLADWGLSADTVSQVSQAVEYSVYTPGSGAGKPLDVLAALSAPEGDWERSPDRFLDKIATTATALLGLVDVEADPVQSREHILLAKLLEEAWREAEDLDLTELIRRIQNPPFDQMGAMEIEQFFPQDERFKLATLLNNLLASPSFRAWKEGDPLNIESLLWTDGGKPRHTVFYLAHLADSERMFFVTLLLGAVEAWMRGQKGTGSLRAILYMDEVHGYLPPTAVPASKPPFLRLLKQARAFGLGLLLGTQNPVDLDYKALSNAGTWFIGRLQTEQDKNRLLDGLTGADAAQGFDRGRTEKIIGRLDKRVFLLHNIHAEGPQVFQTRWALAYLAGPLSLNQIGAVNELVGGAAPAAKGAREESDRAASSGQAASKPAAPSGVAERYWPVEVGAEEALSDSGQEAQLVYHPILGAVATVRFLESKSGGETRRAIAALDAEPDRAGMVRWSEVEGDDIEYDDLATAASGAGSYLGLPAPLNDSKLMRSMEKEFADYLYRDQQLSLASHPELGLVAEPGETTERFHERCLEAASEKRDEEAKKIQESYQRKVEALKKKLSREERELAEDMAEFSSRRMEEWVTHAENLLGFLGGSRSRRRVSTSLTKRRMTTKAKSDIEESEEVIEEFKRDLEDLEEDLAEELDDLDERWVETASATEDVVLTPRRKDIHVDFFGILWLPYWHSRAGEVQPAFDRDRLDL
jgi:hypothetical protein